MARLASGPTANVAVRLFSSIRLAISPACPMFVEANRQTQDMPHETDGHRHPQLHLQAPPASLLQVLERHLEQHHEQHSHEERTEPLGPVLHQERINEDLREHRNGEARNDQQRTGQQAVAKRRPRAVQRLCQQPPDGRPAAPSSEARTRPDDKDHAGVTEVDFLRRLSAGRAGVVDVHHVPGNALHDQEMVEFPVDDERTGQLVDISNGTFALAKTPYRRAARHIS